MKIGILGCGLSGLAVGSHLKSDFEIIEKEDSPGGLLRSEKIDGYVFDTGGSHILFSRNRDVLSEMLRFMPRAIRHTRRTYIFYEGRYLKYPFENGIYALSPEQRYEILLDFIGNIVKKRMKPRNLEDFFVMKFGKKMTEMYFKPYNEKLWRMDMNEIAIDWIWERVPNPPVEDILRSLVGLETDGYLHQMIFYYPHEGGFESFVQNMTKPISDRVKLGEEAKHIKFEDGKIIVETHIERAYDKLISTIPLPVLGKIVGGEMEELVDKLRYNSVTVVGLGVRGNFPNFHWIYVPQKEIPFYRVAFLHNYSPAMAPENRATIIAEISHRPDERIRDPVENVVEGLEKMGFKFDVDVERYWLNKYAYVVYDSNRKKVVDRIKKLLEEMGIVIAGRFGSWEYMNMDEVWLNAKIVANKVDLHESAAGNTQ